MLVADDDIELPAHRAVLASCSHYFYSMFTSELSESRSNKVTLKQMDSQALELLVNFMYTSEIRIVEDNVQVRVMLLTTDNAQLATSLISTVDCMTKNVFNDISLDF